MLYCKKLNFDLLTPSPGSGEVGVGGGRGESHQFFRHVRSSHTLLDKLALFRRRPEIPKSSRTEFTTTYNNPINKFKNRSRIS